MSYGVAITITSTITITDTSRESVIPYFFHVDTASSVKDLITTTAQNAKNLEAKISKVKVTDERGNQHRNLSDSEILDLLLTK